jgi:hypothetical protein
MSYDIDHKQQKVKGYDQSTSFCDDAKNQRITSFFQSCIGDSDIVCASSSTHASFLSNTLRGL